MRIQVLGTGCKKCNDLFEQAQHAAELLGAGDTIEKIDDIDTFFRLGVMRTPALAVDEKVLAAGKVLSAGEIVALIRGMQR